MSEASNQALVKAAVDAAAVIDRLQGDLAVIRERVDAQASAAMSAKGTDRDGDLAPVFKDFLKGLQ